MVREACGDLSIDSLFTESALYFEHCSSIQNLLTLLHSQQACTPEWPDKVDHGLLTDDKLSTVACAVRKMNKLNGQCQQVPELLITRFA